MASRSEQKHDLAHVLWLGGSPCSGKTSVAKRLIERHRLQLYHYDKQERSHSARSCPERHPTICAHAAMSMDERWMHRPVDEMVRATEAAWLERFALVIDDLRALPATATILAEGPGLLPGTVAPLLQRPRQALWLVPTEAFKRAVQPTRGGAPANQTSDAARAYRNLIDLDLQLAANVRRRARDLGLTVIEVDGTKSIEEMAMVVADHFELPAPVL